MFCWLLGMHFHGHSAFIRAFVWNIIGIQNAICAANAFASSSIFSGNVFFCFDCIAFKINPFNNSCIVNSNSPHNANPVELVRRFINKICGFILKHDANNSDC